MNWWNGWGPPPPPSWGPPTSNFYYPPPPPAPPPPEVKKVEAEWKKFVAFKKAIEKEKNGKKDDKKEKKGLQKITGREFPFTEVLLWILFLGPIAGKIYNKLEAALLQWVGQ